ncbi:MAG: TetR/AcrR family transcriptional regulator [Sphingomonadales bacterium]|jgi:AcrR family transcriptional regulator
MRNVKNTKKKILKAAQDIMAKGGFSALKVNALAEAAEVGKPLIYRYFGNMDGVGKALAEKVFEDGSGYKSLMPEVANSDDILKDLVSQGRLLGGDRSLRDMLVWSLASNNSPMDNQTWKTPLQIKPEVNRALTDKIDKVAIYALLKAAIAFLVLYRDRNKNWNGLGLETPKEMVRFEHAMAHIVDKYWPNEGGG